MTRWSPGTRVSLVLFDLDGTLSDSAPGITSSMRTALTHHGLEVPSDDVLNSPENVRKMAEALGTAVVTVPDAASMAAVEVPDLVVPALKRLWDVARAAELPRAAVQA